MSSSNVHLVTASNVFSVNDIGIPPISMDMLLIYLLVQPKVDISGASNLITEGNSVNLMCKVVKGRPEPQITWLKNNTLQGQSLCLFFS